MRKNLLRNLLFAIVPLLSACSTEGRYDETQDTGTADNTERREVLLTLKNELVVSPSSPRAIATAEENTLSMLDVYVFGCETEDGEYTFQQRFSYRDDTSGPIPVNAEELMLASDDADDASTTGLLSLKRGLFVKFYCVANDTMLINPATGAVLASKDLKPITFNKPGSTTLIAAPGYPSEKEFVTLHTPLLKGKENTSGTISPDETLHTPLAMSGAQTTPLDLTDATATSRLRASFRLTRLAARFDIVNHADESRFTIRSISMGNGRRGAYLFPIAATGDTPAHDTDLITYPDRNLTSDNGSATPDANQGLLQGAFYSYPSLQADGGYLILKGLYQVNQTETREVSYQIPFRQQNADGTETRLDITHNHRYTIGITRADDYHLDFTLKVADWTDDGKVDDYEPDNKPGEVTVQVPDALKAEIEVHYDPDRQIYTINMPLKNGSTFDTFIASSSPLQVTKRYDGGPENMQYDWLEISEPLKTRSAASLYKYTFKLKEGYEQLKQHPRAIIRTFDALSGDESILFVEAITVPQPVPTPQPDKAPNGNSDNPNTFDEETQTATLYRITDSSVKVRIACPDGSGLVSKPDWVKVEEESRKGADITYKITLTDRETAATEGEVIFRNEKHPSLENTVTIKLADASIKPSFTEIGGNTYTPADPDVPSDKDKVTVKITDGNTFLVRTTSIDGVKVKTDFGDGPEWLRHDGESATPAARVNSTQSGITFSLVNSKLAGAKPVTVTLVNKIGGVDYQFIVTPELQTGILQRTSATPIDNAIDESTKTITLYKLPAGNPSNMKVTVISYGGSVLSSDNECVEVTKSATTRTTEVTQTENEASYTLTPVSLGTATLTLSNHTDPSKNITYTVKVVSSEITIPATFTAKTDAVEVATTIQVSSPKGFTASITDYAHGEGGQSWLKLTTPTVEAGQNKNFTVQVNALPVTMRPTTVTLKNNIKGGGDKTLTVHPTYTIPTLTMTNRKPVQNALTTSGASATMKLYRVSGSQMAFSTTATGGTVIANATSGLTVTGSGGFGKTQNYTITLKTGTTTNQSFDIVNKSDSGKKTTVTVNNASTTISVSNQSVKVANSGNHTIGGITSPEGCTATFTGTWGTGGGQWFDINGANGKVAAGTNKSFLITQRDNRNTVMKAVRIKLTNVIEGGESAEFTLTPTGFTAPTLNASSATYAWAKNNVYIPARSSGTAYTLTKTSGNATVTSSNTNVATVSVNGTAVTITPKGVGSATITVSNASWTSTKSTFSVQVNAANLYNGKQVWYFGGLLIAPENANGGQPLQPWNGSVLNTACPSGWHVPTNTEWEKVRTTNNYTIYKSVFTDHVNNWSQYWGNSENGGNAYIFYLRHSDAQVLGNFFGKNEPNVYVRCCATP